MTHVAHDGFEVLEHTPVKYWLAPQEAAVVHAMHWGDVKAEHDPLRYDPTGQDVVHGAQGARLADVEYVPDGQAMHWRSLNGPQGYDGFGCVPAAHDAVQATHTRLEVAVASTVWYS